MICIISANKLEATRWAEGKDLDESEWFFPESELDLLTRKNFHVIVTSSVGFNMPPHWFERFYRLAKERGRMK